MSIENIGNPNPQELRLNNYAKNFLRETSRRITDVLSTMLRYLPSRYRLLVFYPKDTVFDFYMQS